MFKWLFILFAAFYAAAMFLFFVGTFGWFGQEQDPLSGVFLMPLGLPWNLLGDRFGLASVALGVLAPLPNLAILYWLWKR